jgi:glycine/D-amino acid oxidase-like deaminating enzyme
MAGPGCLASEPVVVVGAGLTGGLIALALARLGLTVIQVAPPSQEPDANVAGANATGTSATGTSATALSYGSLSLGTTGRAWRNLERLHGPLGWTSCGLKLHDRGWLGRRLTLPASRVDGPTLMAALPRALAAAGVQQRPAHVQGLEAGPTGGWRLMLLDLPPSSQRQGPQLEPRGEFSPWESSPWEASLLEPSLRQPSLRQPAERMPPLGVTPLGASILEARQVVLAAGAGCLDLWPPLTRQLGISWAGVLAMETNPGSNPWLRQVAKGRLVLNQQEQRLGLEDQAGWLAEEHWIVDASAAPWGPKGVLVGQISLVRPLDGTRQAPDPARMEERLRQGLQGWDPQLAALIGTYRQIPVAFGLQGRALVGPVPGAPGLWTFTGFRSPFSTAPPQAVQLAQSLTANLTNQAEPNES